MAPIVEKKVVVPKPTPGNDVHIVGLKKIAPLKYAVVTGTINEPKIDTVAQPLDFASEALKLAVLKLLETVP